jgi:hypothetical protein
MALERRNSPPIKKVRWPSAGRQWLLRQPRCLQSLPKLPSFPKLVGIIKSTRPTYAPLRRASSRSLSRIGASSHSNDISYSNHQKLENKQETWGRDGGDSKMTATGPLGHVWFSRFRVSARRSTGRSAPSVHRQTTSAGFLRNG